MKRGHLKQGSKYIEQAKNRELENPLFLSLYAYFLMLQDKDLQLEQVFALMDDGKLGLDQTLPLILKARFLEEKQDWVRALNTWEKTAFSGRQNYLG